MSIRDEIEARIREGRLVMVAPMVAGVRHSRVIYATAEFFSELTGPQSCRSAEVRMGMLYSDLDHFSVGGLIVVSSGKQKTCYMKQLDPQADEIWEIRSRDPKPSIRVFGRFAATDVFVATNMADRGSLGEIASPAWRDECVRCGAEWRKLFPTYPAHSGASINDYLSDNVADLRRFP